ncbi:unnamed protein product [Schistosoma curassoni]|uniref:Uncharacterized protein n=1 Tax=Schistosoma curassoni TaxID=6186 RepID=A0A183JMT3_9TREM|nr:unnamed protein product [Schistosoma curassoni]
MPELNWSFSSKTVLSNEFEGAVALTDSFNFFVSFWCL